MQLLSRERRTRDRFTALHPEVAVTEVAALPGDVHDLAGLRDIGDRLAANERELPEPQPTPERARDAATRTPTPAPEGNPETPQGLVMPKGPWRCGP